MKNTVKMMILLAVALLVTSVTAFADGWTVENNQWTYYQNGNKLYNTWKTDSAGNYYYLGSDGVMVTDRFVEDERYVDADGKMVTSAWRQLNGRWYYFDAAGKSIRDRIRQINNRWYYFGPDGMETGWVSDDNGNYYYADPADGHILTGTWKRLAPAEEMTPEESSFAGDGTYWYYFMGSNGRMVKAEADSYKTQNIEGRQYCFDEYGCMQTGWVRVEETDVPIAGFRYYNDTESIGPLGAAHTGWLSAYPPEQAGFGTDVVWYYFDSKGVPYYGTEIEDGTDDEALAAKFKKLSKNGTTNTYLFNKYGNPVYGLRKVVRKDGEVTSMYFGNANECCLQLGEKNITEADGTVSTFHFESNGYGYNGVKNNRLYYMGKLQKATDDTYAYYTVKDKRYLVTRSGTLAKNVNNGGSKKDKYEFDYKSDSKGEDAGGLAGDSELDVPSFVVTDF